MDSRILSDEMPPLVVLGRGLLEASPESETRLIVLLPEWSCAVEMSGSEEPRCDPRAPRAAMFRSPRAVLNQKLEDHNPPSSAVSRASPFSHVHHAHPSFIQNQ
jgi:hypothetical protein